MARLYSFFGFITCFAALMLVPMIGIPNKVSHPGLFHVLDLTYFGLAIALGVSAATMIYATRKYDNPLSIDSVHDLIGVFGATIGSVVLFVITQILARSGLNVDTIGLFSLGAVHVAAIVSIVFILASWDEWYGNFRKARLVREQCEY